jgi:hypothetical protein
MGDDFDDHLALRGDAKAALAQVSEQDVAVGHRSPVHSPRRTWSSQRKAQGVFPLRTQRALSFSILLLCILNGLDGFPNASLCVLCGGYFWVFSAVSAISAVNFPVRNHLQLRIFAVEVYHNCPQ